MTPKEKSIELVNKFLRYVPAEEEYEFPYAKQCALIAVDEIIEVVYWQSVKDYWREVKQEIENN